MPRAVSLGLEPLVSLPAKKRIEMAREEGSEVRRSEEVDRPNRRIPGPPTRKSHPAERMSFWWANLGV